MDPLKPPVRASLSRGRLATLAAHPTAATERRPGWILAAFLAGVTVARLGYLAVGPLDLSPDEAHYWEWSRRLDWSYYSKGPLIAYLIRGLTATFGSSALSIRLGAVLLSLFGALAIYRLGHAAIGDRRAALLATVGLQLTPLVWAGSLLMTIDPPFVAAWVVALLCLHRALVAGSRAAWLGAALAVGVGLLAKYTMFFVLPGLLLYLSCAPEARRWGRRPEPYLAGALALAIFMPVLVWNARQGWVSARHVATQGRGTGWTIATLLEFVGSQAGVLTPLVAGILAWAAWYGIREGLVRRREPYRFLSAFGIPVLVFYLALSLQGKVQANWPAAAYPPLALVAVAALREREPRLGAAQRRRQTRLLVAAGSLALVVTVAGHGTDLLAIPPALDPTTRLKGWRDLGRAVSNLQGDMPAPERTFLVSDRYQITSELAFYVDGRPPAYNVNLGRRLNQYDLWEGPNARLGWDAIYVQEGTGRPDERVIAAFERLEGPIVVQVRRGDRAVRTFSLYRGFSFRGVATPTGPTTY